MASEEEGQPAPSAPQARKPWGPEHAFGGAKPLLCFTPSMRQEPGRDLEEFSQALSHFPQDESNRGSLCAPCWGEHSALWEWVCMYPGELQGTEAAGPCTSQVGILTLSRTNVYKDSILLLFLSYCFVDDLLTLRAASRQAVRYLLTGPLWVCALCRCIDTAREAGPSLGLTGCVST